MGFLGSSGITLVDTVGGIYLLMLLLRFLLQIARADFYNPVSQSIVRLTDPVVRPLRRVIPGYRGIDFATLFAALAVQAAIIVALIAMSGYNPQPIGKIVSWAFVGNLLFILKIYYFAIFASVIMSFVMMFSGNPAPHPLLQLTWQLTEPVVAPVRSIIPAMGGLDFSPVVVLFCIKLLLDFIIQTFGITIQMANVIIGV